MPNTCFLLYATCILATTAFHFSHGRPLEPRETRNIQPEGSSLKNIIHKSSVIDPDTPGEWEIYYDESSGHPYYHNKITGMTQWENPFGRQTTDDVDPSKCDVLWYSHRTVSYSSSLALMWTFQVSYMKAGDCTRVLNSLVYSTH